MQKKKASEPRPDLGEKSMPTHGALQKERRSNLKVVRRILSQWNKVRRSHPRVTIMIPIQ